MEICAVGFRSIPLHIAGDIFRSVRARALLSPGNNFINIRAEAARSRDLAVAQTDLLCCIHRASSSPIALNLIRRFHVVVPWISPIR